MDYIRLQAGKYQAHISPQLGGNVVYFYDTDQKREILVGTHEEEEIKARPSAYGMPLLLPPNRIADGRFEYEGRTYQFPINEGERHNHLHGFFLLAQFQVLKEEHRPEKDRLILEYQFREGDENFQYFPHQMTIQKEYELSDRGLALNLTIQNQSSEKIPMMFAYHTAFPLMGPGQSSKDMNIRMSVNARVRLNDRLLGTEEYIPADPIAELAATGGFSPVAESLDNVYQMKKFGFRGAIITYPQYQAQTIYQVDEIFHYMVVWNDEAKGQLICLEPQTYRNNGINLPSWQEDGIDLEPGQKITAKTRVCSEPLAIYK